MLFPGCRHGAAAAQRRKERGADAAALEGDAAAGADAGLWVLHLACAWLCLAVEAPACKKGWRRGQREMEFAVRACVWVRVSPTTSLRLVRWWRHGCNEQSSIVSSFHPQPSPSTAGISGLKARLVLIVSSRMPGTAWQRPFESPNSAPLAPHPMIQARVYLIP